MDWMIVQDSSGNEDGPVFDGPRDMAIWSLYAQAVGRDGPHFEEWEMYRYGSGLTHGAAELLAVDLGFTGSPIGG